MVPIPEGKSAVARFWHRSIVAFLVSYLIVGCTSWTATQAPLTSLDGRKVRVSTEDGERFEGLLMHPDTLGERVLICVSDNSRPLVIDTSTIKSAEVRKVNGERTAGLVLLGVAAVVFTIVQIKMVFNDVDY
jgi:hypothetical protein